MGGAIGKKIIDAIKDADGEAKFQKMQQKNEDHRIEVELQHEQFQIESREAKERHEVAQREAKERHEAAMRKADEDTRKIQSQLEIVIAQNAELTGKNPEKINHFRSRVAKEQREKIVDIINNQLTHALDSYDGIILRYDPLAIQRQFDEEE